MRPKSGNALGLGRLWELIDFSSCSFFNSSTSIAALRADRGPLAGGERAKGQGEKEEKELKLELRRREKLTNVEAIGLEGVAIAMGLELVVIAEEAISMLSERVCTERLVEFELLAVHVLSVRAPCELPVDPLAWKLEDTEVVFSSSEDARGVVRR